MCRVHGGSAPQVRDAARRRLLQLVDPALSRLEDLIVDSVDERVVLAAIKEILTRAGIEPPLQMDRLTEDQVEALLDAEIARLEAIMVNTQ